MHCQSAACVSVFEQLPRVTGAVVFCGYDADIGGDCQCLCVYVLVRAYA